MTFTRKEFIEKVRETVGTPFHHQGRTLGVGFDCAGIIAWALKELEHPVPDVVGYPRVSPGMAMFHHMAAVFDEIHPDDAKPGDILMFWYSNRRHVQHVAVYSQEGHPRKGGMKPRPIVIHAHSTLAGGVVVEHDLQDDWAKRYAWAFTPRGMVD
jgi:cell wall-associated NlpC family hydrolase